MFVTRREAVRYALGLTTALAGCAQFNQQAGQMTLDQIKAYVESFVSMVTAAAQVYLASAAAKEKQLVETIISKIDDVAQAIQSATAPADVRALLLQIIQFVQEIEPDIAPFLGVAAPYVALGLAVLQAFISAVQPPQNAPTPAQMKATVRRLKAAHPTIFRNE
jgi:hypothetical protein